MSELTDHDRRALLVLARSTIESNLIKDRRVIRPANMTPALTEKRGCFVTLHKRGNLRGCIGTIEPKTSLVASVEENAVNAAFSDPRFPPLAEDELPDIEIEISVLTVPKTLEYSSPEELKQKLKPHIHGVILSRGWQRSTFLPQVWKQLPETEDFLKNLCQKAGMERNCWKDKNTMVKVYEAEYFSEGDYLQ
ncbi:MAG: AmmeMemoRadiSam system protein A [Deltaproteobacteria bacterium]|nr:AmmeMemoRadiSam system protein A [Deltaproteobacteria bacterium]MBW1960549.1 AmmeMemoRadiSam system protein A [Deltaproteobacteria bacterium]MBW1996190.1 AmmeMemoRadiSam system protein A [Deltaproteobacteria bacterium]MBW2150660.1 AmmeMemoRadiSam system protein A [Deltaproteobacteria bacterium]